MISSVYETSVVRSPDLVDTSAIKSILDPTCTSYRVPIRSNNLRTSVADPHHTFTMKTNSHGAVRMAIFPRLFAVPTEIGGRSHINMYIGEQHDSVPIEISDGSIDFECSQGPVSATGKFYSGRLNSMAI